MQLNLIFLLPTLVVATLMAAIYLFPTHMILQIPVGDAGLQVDVWNLYVVPLPLILLAPFTAGLTIVTRNFSREEHAFVWSDFWEAVRNNWKLFLLNGVIIYLVYFLLSFSLLYYYNNAFLEPIYYLPFWICVVIGLLFIFAQYYLPVMFITFDLKFSQMYRNALIFILAGFGRNLLITLILGIIVILIGVVPIMPLTITIFLLFMLFIAFSFASYLVNFSVYPVIDRYMIQPYQERERAKSEKAEPDPLAEKYKGLFDSAPEPEEENEKEQYVYINGKLVKRSNDQEEE